MCVCVCARSGDPGQAKLAPRQSPPLPAFPAAHPAAPPPQRRALERAFELEFDLVAHLDGGEIAFKPLASHPRPLGVGAPIAAQARRLIRELPRPFFKLEPPRTLS